MIEKSSKPITKLPSFYLKRGSAKIVEYDDGPFQQKIVLSPTFNNYKEDARLKQKQTQSSSLNTGLLGVKKSMMTPFPSPYNQNSLTGRYLFKSINTQMSLPKLIDSLSVRKIHQSSNFMSSGQEQGEQGQQINYALLPALKIETVRLQNQYPFLMKTKAGCTYNKMTKTNQDQAITNPKCLEKFNCQFFAVCDGHGTNGHFVSSFLGKTIPKNLQKQLSILVKWTKAEIYNALSCAFLISNRELMTADFDTNLSGSTTVSILIHSSKIYCANVGDSRVIVCSQSSKNVWSAKALNIDHKPDYTKERQRILKFGGRIDFYKDEFGNALGPERVWLKHIDAPGLAMTRSFGDKVGYQAGIIAEPEIFDYDVEPANKFIVVASDGVFEFLSNEEVMNQVIACYEKNNLILACDKIISLSTVSWQRQSEVRDDITCIVIFLK